MLRSKYGSQDIARDAVAFTSTRFGEHYLSRLEALRDRARSLSEDIDLSDSYRAHQSTRAAAFNDELEYFKGKEAKIKQKFV